MASLHVVNVHDYKISFLLMKKLIRFVMNKATILVLVVYDL